MIDLDTLQREIYEWATHNFGERKPSERLIGATEEFGELVTCKLEEIVPLLHAIRQLGKVCHHQTKQDSGIRGSYEYHDEKLKDALGDIMIFLLDYCTLKGWSYEEIIRNTWDEVRQRDWTVDPLHGLTKPKEEEKL